MEGEENEEKREKKNPDCSGTLGAAVVQGEET